MSPEEREAFLNSPATLAVPPGVQRNFENPDNDLSTALPLFIVIFILSNLVFAGKMYSQLFIVKRMFTEDYLLVVAWIVYAFAWGPLGILLTLSPVGVHQWDLTVRQYAKYMFRWNATLIAYCVVIFFVKVNILLQYLRIFVPAGIRDFTFWASHALIWFNFAFYLPYIFINIFICTPRRKFWDMSVEGGHCVDWKIASLFATAFTVISDILILILPQRVIYNLSMTRRKKIGLSALFTIGVFACVSSSLRLYHQIKFTQDSSDTTFKLYKIGFWATTQLTAGFLVSCLPAAPMLTKHIGKQPWAVKFGSSLQSMLRISGSEKSGRSDPIITTIGGGKPKYGQREFHQGQTRDIEFEELVNKTDFSILASTP